MTLAAGNLVSYRGGRRFAYRNGDSRLALGHARGGYRLAADLGHFDLAALDLVHPPRFMKQILKIGDDCFSSVLACTAQGERDRLQAGAHRAAAPDASSARGTRRCPGTMLTLFDDERLETVSVFAQEDGHYVFPRLRPGTYRLRARLIGYEDVVQADVVLAKRPGHSASRSRWSPTANTNDQLPASAWFSLILDKWPDPKIRGRLHALVRQLPPDRELPRSAAPRPRPSGAPS